IGFWVALVLSPLLVGVLGAVVERYGLRRVHRWGHVPELLFTFGLTYIMVEIVQIIWGRSTVPYEVPEALRGSLFTLFTTTFPIYRGFMMGVAIFMLVAIWLLLTRTRFGLVIQAALTHPDAVEALGHNVPRVFILTFGGGCALDGLAGVGAVRGGLGSLAGAFCASRLIGLLRTLRIGLDRSGIDLLATIGIQVDRDTFGYSVWSLTLPQIALMLPYLLMVLMLIVRRRG